MVVVRRLLAESSAEAERIFSPLRVRSLDMSALLKKTGAASLEKLWSTIVDNPYPFSHSSVNSDCYDTICSGDKARIVRQAGDAIEHRVNLLGSGVVVLGGNIDWHKDYKSGFSWPPMYFRSIDYNNPDRPSDVKFPWEVSRMQWLIPAGQAYLLSGDEKYAVAVKDILSDWIDANPYAHSVNWACTMEVALRILSWTWFFHVFHKSKAWQDEAFRFKFLKALYLHGDFTARHLERSDINGNHYTADAAGLVFAGLFFGKGKGPERWQKLGWDILCDEITKQVFADGVDFEASVPYHRLVLELFLLPALYRQKCGLEVPDFYKERVISMARFTAAYSRPDGSVPLWGDADDARALPFGSQPINDHRYLIGIVGLVWDVQDLKRYASDPRSEAFWLLGPDAAVILNNSDQPASSPPSQAFPDGGFYVMRNDRDHIFIDCGPIGLAGRGGHGHNDCLSFEAVLDGVHLISDCGAYVYTASFEERNNFRSTAYHNTPQIDGEEINRFIRWDYLWTLHNDAKPEVKKWMTSPTSDIFCGTHNGYRRLCNSVMPVRHFILDHTSHILGIHDVFEGQDEHTIEIPLHLAPGVNVVDVMPNRLRLSADKQYFHLFWNNEQEWDISIKNARVSQSYGIVLPDIRVSWKRNGPLRTSFTYCLVPEETTLTNPLDYIIQLIIAWEKK